MATAFDIVRWLRGCAERIQTGNGFLTNAGLHVHENVTLFSASDAHPLVFIGYPGADKTAEYPGQVRQEKAAEFQLAMEFEVDPEAPLLAAESAYLDLVRSVFGPGAPTITGITSYEYSGDQHIPRMAGGDYGQISVFLTIRWIEAVGRE